MATNLTILSYRRDKYVVKEKVVLFGLCEEEDARSFYILLDNGRRIVVGYETREQCLKALDHFCNMMAGKTTEYTIPIEPIDSLVT